MQAEDIATIGRMYAPNYFEETRVETLHSLIQAHPLGTLVTLTTQGLEANHIPFEIDPAPAPFGTLRCHVARANSVWKDFSREIQALAVFQGTDTYIRRRGIPPNRSRERSYLPGITQWFMLMARCRLSKIGSGCGSLSNGSRIGTKADDRIRGKFQRARRLHRSTHGLDRRNRNAHRPADWQVESQSDRPARDQAGAIDGLLRLDTEDARHMAELIRSRQSPER